jgi:hypothetical protein
MPLCGFNKKMISGLQQFSEGLYDQAEKRAVEDNIPLRKSFDNEMVEMDIFLDILSKKNPISTQALTGITQLAQALYRNGQGLDQPKEQFFERFGRLLDFLVELDDKYYKEFRPNTDPEVALKKLGEWIS